MIFAVSCARFDADVQRDVGAKLREDKRFDRVTLTVKKGEVALDGEVENAAAKSDAETQIKEIQGVKNIVNNLQIKSLPTATPSAAPTTTPTPRTRSRRKK